MGASNSLADLEVRYIVRHVGEILLFNQFFPIVDRCLSCEDIARETCIDGHKVNFARGKIPSGARDPESVYI